MKNMIFIKLNRDCNNKEVHAICVALVFCNEKKKGNKIYRFVQSIAMTGYMIFIAFMAERQSCQENYHIILCQDLIRINSLA